MTFFWFRRDLRLEDNAGLYFALKESSGIQPIFIFDTNILKKLDNNRDKRVSFIYRRLKELNEELLGYGSALWIFNGEPLEVFRELTDKYNIEKVYANADYEPYAVARDRRVGEYLDSAGVEFTLKKDAVIFEKSEVVKKDGSPYTIYTPYMKKWKAKLQSEGVERYDVSKSLTNLRKTRGLDIPPLEKFGFELVDFEPPLREIDIEIVENYELTRDFPALHGTTRIGPHLRYGTISVREAVKVGMEHSEKWLEELIWRDFYQAIIYHFPYSANSSFKKKYDNIAWENDEAKFEKWKSGETGYPIVDAGMRQLNETGYMHNRLRMITANFLTKLLLIDWRWGERYFASKLLDYDLASNVGGWQWASGSGCDAAPYFRIFNPYTQAKKFDPDNKFIEKFVPEFKDSENYVEPIIDYKSSREKALRVYKESLQRDID